MLDPACVKVVWVSEATLESTIPEDDDVLDDRLPPDPTAEWRGRAIYFSRAPIPHARDWKDELLTATPAHFYQHLGLYVYRREFLPLYASMPRTPAGKAGNLEQLRVLEAGYRS